MYITEAVFELVSFCTQEAKLYESYDRVSTIICKAKKKKKNVDTLEIEDSYMSQVNICHITHLTFSFLLFFLSI